MKDRKFSEGQIITVGGMDWYVLYSVHDRVKCISKSPVGKSCYRAGYTGYELCGSDISVRLNDAYKDFVQTDSCLSRMILDMVLPQETDDGIRYGANIVCKFGLITPYEYRKHRRCLPDRAITSTWTAGLTSACDLQMNVQYIDENGAIYPHKMFEEHDFRATCVFDRYELIDYLERQDEKRKTAITTVQEMVRRFNIKSSEVFAG